MADRGVFNGAPVLPAFRRHLILLSIEMASVKNQLKKGLTASLTSWSAHLTKAGGH